MKSNVERPLKSEKSFEKGELVEDTYGNLYMVSKNERLDFHLISCYTIYIVPGVWNTNVLGGFKYLKRGEIERFTGILTLDCRNT